MLHASLVLNIIVLTPLLWALSQDTSGMSEAFGPDSPARRILSAVYFAILLMSIGLLGGLVFSERDVVPHVVALLVMQVIYKVTTAVVLGVAHPVVVTNLLISAVHMTTLLVLMR